MGYEYILVLQWIPPSAERRGNIKHLQMGFNLVNNVTWPFVLASPSVFICSGLITGFAEAFSVNFLEAFNYVVCLSYFFVFEKVGNLYQFNVDRKKLSTSENGVLCGFINILSQALYNLFCVTS